MKKSALTGMAVLLAVFSLSLFPAYAQEKEGGLGLKVEVTAANAFEADMTGGKGAFSVAGGKIKVSYHDFHFAYERRVYSWDKIEKLPFGNGKDDPWGDLHSLELGWAHRGRLAERWGYVVGANVSSSFENSADGSSIGGGVFFMAMYGWSPKLQLGVGAFGTYHPVRSLALPAVSVLYNWRAREGFYFAFGYPETHVSYRFSPKAALKFRVIGFDQYVYQLADDSKVQKQGYVETQDLSTGLRLVLNPIERLKLSLGVNYFFLRRLTLFDEDGDNDKEYDVDETWGLMARVSFAF